MLAAAAYGYGWIICALFFSHFDISPEEAGVSFDWLAVRAFLITVVVLIIILIVRFLSRTAERYGPVVRVVESRPVVDGIKLLVGACLGIAANLLTDRSGNNNFLKYSIFALLALASVAWIRVGSSGEPLQIAWNARILLKGIAGAMAGFVVVTLVCAPYRMTAQLANDVKAGQPVQISILPSLIGFEIVRVHVTFVSSSSSLPSVVSGKKPGTCLMHLGGSDGNSYYYDFHSGHVFVLNDQDIVAMQPC